MFLNFNNTPMIHFYEPKYQVEHIHEFWNTISNFSFILIGEELRRKKSPVGIPLILVGICSTMFHATGTLFWEATDELSILVLIHVILFNSGCHKLKPNYRLIFTPFLLYGLAVYYRKFWIFYLILTVPVLMSVVQLREQAIKYNKYEFFENMIYCFLAGKFFWYLEQFGYFWFGHSIWHIYSAIAVGFAGKIINLS